MFFYSASYWTYMLPAIGLMLIAQLLVSAAYRKWSRVGNSTAMTGAEAAQRLLSYGGLGSVSIEGTRARLGDHYDPRSETLRLSPGVAQGRSVASMAIAAHEIGHAVQHREGDLLLRLRAALVPAVNIGSTLGWIMILAGLLLGLQGIAELGLIAFSLGAVFALATLPVEFGASSRAKRLLDQAGLMRTQEERRGVSAVLNAAAFTYVAGLATALLQLLYYASLVGGMGGRRRS
ncbi:MAG: zinc metallopeptidase [Anaerolineales bacterium]|jgi:Zn-dependent membrane protease YugP